MKKFIIFISVVVFALILADIFFLHFGFYINSGSDKQISVFIKTEYKNIYIDSDGDGVYEPFEIRGVDMGTGMPGKWASDFAVSKKTYKRWFKKIQEMRANTIRVYTVQSEDFYDAFYEYNKDNKTPLYLLQGVLVDDYAGFSHMDAFDDEFLLPFVKDCLTAADVIHGNKKIALSYGNKGSGSFRKDISRWVIGYILGSEWEPYTVEYTNQINEETKPFVGKYMYASENASPFENFLARIGDKLTEYETEKYGSQRLIAFTNSPQTDPLVYPEGVVAARNKTAIIDTEHIKTKSENFISGTFASYHIYPYYPDYIDVMENFSSYTEKDFSERQGIGAWRKLKYSVSKLKGDRIENYIDEESLTDRYGRHNTYLAYLRALNLHHTIPVVISEYGASSSRGIAQTDKNTGRNQGNMSEREQGRVIIECYKDIMDSGCAGSCIFSWQDEWHKRTRNTEYVTDTDKTPYWSDYQTSGQFFGLLTFDPGKEKSICYVDGDISEWEGEKVLADDGKIRLSVMYDEKFIYFLVVTDGDSEEKTIYIPIDINPKSGAKYCENYDIYTERPCDFVIKIKGRENSRILVQKRYEALNSVYGREFYGELPYFNPPKADGTRFVGIFSALTKSEYIPYRKTAEPFGKKYETGRLKYGNANPGSPDFDSTADYMFGGENNKYIEIRIPWGLLNFSNPSEMEIYDDYFENYGIENLAIDEMYAGAADGESKGSVISMERFPLKGWGNKVKFHERLKKSYYMVKSYWTERDREVRQSEK